MRVWVVLAALAAGPAGAAPRFLPDQDVSVSYALNAPGQAAQNVQLSYDAADSQARVDSPQGLYVLANLAQGQAQVVIPALHAFVEAPELSDLTHMVADAGGARFTPLGHGVYAGLGCEKYLVLDADGSGTACITPDGVVLHFAGQDASGSAEVTATAVAYGPQPEQKFTTPEGFAEVTLPPGALAALLQGQ
jgi:hypothetical protein